MTTVVESSGGTQVVSLTLAKGRLLSSSDCEVLKGDSHLEKGRERLQLLTPT